MNRTALGGSALGSLLIVSLFLRGLFPGLVVAPIAQFADVSSPWRPCVGGLDNRMGDVIGDLVCDYAGSLLYSGVTRLMLGSMLASTRPVAQPSAPRSRP